MIQTIINSILTLVLWWCFLEILEFKKLRKRDLEAILLLTNSLIQLRGDLLIFYREEEALYKQKEPKRMSEPFFKFIVPESKPVLTCPECQGEIKFKPGLTCNCPDKITRLTKALEVAYVFIKKSQHIQPCLCLRSESDYECSCGKEKCLETIRQAKGVG